MSVEAVNVKEMVGRNSNRKNEKGDKNDDGDKQKCGLYLAVSSTSTAEAPKLGVFAGTLTWKYLDKVNHTVILHIPFTHNYRSTQVEVTTDFRVIIKIFQSAHNLVQSTILFHLIS